MGRIYMGTRTSCECLVEVADEGKRREREPLAPRHDIISHSPAGFEWGYEGGGPAQLALAILADAFGPVVAEMGHQRFRRDVVANLPREEWTLTTDDLREWLSSLIEAKSELEAVLLEQEEQKRISERTQRRPSK
ncbi:MAG: DUF6166 domain-containing protein [Gemmatimonadales bacterium]|nr:DUF6166 domain-containing protein [Gemmatimonadales bacterium]